jgi:cell division protein FtsB
MSSLLKNLTMAAAIVLLAAYAVVALRGPQGLPALSDKRAEIVRLQEQNATLQREILRKRERIRILENHSEQQELEIRKQLNLVKPGEKIFFLPEEETQADPESADPGKQ